MKLDHAVGLEMKEKKESNRGTTIKQTTTHAPNANNGGASIGHIADINSKRIGIKANRTIRSVCNRPNGQTTKTNKKKTTRFARSGRIGCRKIGRVVWQVQIFARLEAQNVDEEAAAHPEGGKPVGLAGLSAGSRRRLRNWQIRHVALRRWQQTAALRRHAADQDPEDHHR